MSKGIGRAQRQILASLAAVEEVQHVSTYIDLLMSLAGEPNRANLYRGLHMLITRGLITQTDTADRTARCRYCHHLAEVHHEDNHGRGKRWCTLNRPSPRSYLTCPCYQYGPTPPPRARWRISLTAAGRALVPEEALPPLIGKILAHQERLESWERMIENLATKLSR
jgi:hypothetical protein